MWKPHILWIQEENDQPLLLTQWLKQNGWEVTLIASTSLAWHKLIKTLMTMTLSC